MIVWALVGVYISVVVLLNIPTVQHFVGSKVSETLSQKLGTEVTVGRVDLGLLNRVIIDDVVIKDQRHRDMFLSRRLSAKISIIDILQGRISISSAQIFSVMADIIKPSAAEPLNCQFVIDSLQSKDTTSNTPLDLHIGSLVIRNSNISYNRLDIPVKHNIFDVNHIKVSNLSAHILLNKLTEDSLSVIIKKLSVQEENSDLGINKLTFNAIADKRHINIYDFILETANSSITFNLSASLAGKKVTNYKAVISKSKLSTKDAALFLPQLSNLNRTVSLNTTIEGTATSIHIPYVNLATNDRTLTLAAKGDISSFHDKKWQATISSLHVDSHLINDILAAFNRKDSGEIISKVGFVNAKATASRSGDNYKGMADIKTALGSVNATGSYVNKHLTAKVNTCNLHLPAILNTANVGDLNASLNIQTDLVGGRQMLANTKASLATPLLRLGGNDFRNLNVNINQQGKSAQATLLIADLNVNANINIHTPDLAAVISAMTGKSSNASSLTVNADIAHINPHALGLINKWQSRSFSTSLSVDVNDICHPLDDFTATIDKLDMSAPEGNYHINHITASSMPHGDGTRVITLDSDFANAKMEGAFDFNTLPQIFTDLVASHLPTLPGIKHHDIMASRHRNMTIDANISDTEILQKVFGIKLSIADPVTINGYIDGATEMSDITVNAPSLTYGSTIFHGTKLHIYSPDDILHIAVCTSRQEEDGTPLNLNIEGQAFDNHLNTKIKWVDGNEMAGTINASSRFMTNAMGKAQTTVDILPSEIMIGDTAWQVRPSTITYYADHLDVDSFSIERGSQHIRIDGTATPSSLDSLIVSLRDVNVGYVMDLIDFHSVEFDGLASGTAIATSLFSTPSANANIIVRDFTFENGRMGTLNAMARWDNEHGQIDIDGLCDDTPGKTKIDGYVSIKRNYIDLGIKADRTRLEFLQSFCSSFLSDVQAEGSGYARIFGDLSTVNLTGKLVANGSIHVTSLGTDYTLHNDTVTCIPNEIIFNHDSIFDKRCGYGLVSGALHHKHLTRMTFDFDIDAHHMLCYNFPDLNGSTFCGYCIGTGSCKIKGLPGEITFDIDAYPEETSQITYNVSSPDAIQNQEFITWRDGNVTGQSEYAGLTRDSGQLRKTGQPDDDDDDSFRTDIRLNFLIHCTPESTLRLIMDQRTGDLITLNGSGTLHATWYNKGGMQIFGNYNVDHGTYKMTMQQVITKNFEFQPGGSIVFSGDPFESTLRLQALYVVPSVSLSDLNLGSSLSSGTVRVNCLMNITGTAEHPTVDFDLALPQASTDIQQMITSLMDSEQQRTQQVIYLLSIGRFYAADNIAANSNATETQTSLAMQSFLSGTLSQQLNNIISSQLLKSTNWNFGANISPGDEGMNNAEYEGLINGRLFNNRLLINGQFGYRDNVNTATSSFIGDFDVRYLITPGGNIQVKVYNQATDRYFIKNNLNTQGIGIILKHDFNNIMPQFLRREKK